MKWFGSLCFVLGRDVADVSLELGLWLGRAFIGHLAVCPRMRIPGVLHEALLRKPVMLLIRRYVVL